jgi:hypothetical protein
MGFGISERHAVLGCVVALAALLLIAPNALSAQGRGGGRGAGQRGAGQRSARASAPIDITGYWVSVVTEDWRFRMIAPPKGDYDSVPLTPAARKIADAWDPAKDEASGEQCRSYGAAAIMRVPGRINISWQDDNTLKIETDAGTQTRLFHFNDVPPPTAERSWQGHSTAQWRAAQGGREGRASGASTAGGSLTVTTTHMRAGYLRKNGVPYSENAVMTEYYNTFKEPNGDQWLIITTLVQDPLYLTQPFITSTHFKKQPDQKGWQPSPCSAR